jgi:Flp pilus assembly protein TadG
MRNLFSLIDRFRKDRRGNIAVIFTIALLPILTAIGCAIDYSLAARMRAKLQGAADAASVGAIARKSPGYDVLMGRFPPALPMPITSSMAI